MGRKRKNLATLAIYQTFRKYWFEKLIGEEPFTPEERKNMAAFFCPQEYKQKFNSKSKRGRPLNSKTTTSRNYEIAIKYYEMYSPYFDRGCSDSALEALKTEYGFKDISSIIKAIKPYKKSLLLFLKSPWEK